MKRTIALIIGLLMLCGVALADGSRMQIAYTGLYTAGPENKSTVLSFRIGISKSVAHFANGGALYAVALGEYGDNDQEKVKGAGGELVYFPVAPTGKGIRIFGIAGTNVTNIKNYADISNLTFWQAATGLGLYWDFNLNTALWIAGKAITSEDRTFVNVGVGLSIATF